MHGPMLEQLAHHLDIAAEIETTVPEALGLGNMMMALAVHREFAFHSVGALGVIEMTAPGRAAYVAQGLDRLGVPKKQSHYFALHAVLDVKHSRSLERGSHTAAGRGRLPAGATHRRRGVAAALVWRAMLQALSRGIRAQRRHVGESASLKASGWRCAF